MTRVLDETLRAAVRDLADGVGAVPDLAARALGQGRRLRRRRVAAAGVALVAVVAVALPFVLLRPAPATPPATPTPTVTPSPTMLATPGADWTTKPLVLPGGWVVTRAQAKGGSGSGFLLDRGRGRYVTTNRYDGIFPAPTGSLVAVHDNDRPKDIGLVDLASGKTRWYQVDGALSVPRWSPDGRRLLTTHRVDHFGFIVLATDGTKQTHLVDSRAWFCTDFFCDFTWTRNGRVVNALPSADVVWVSDNRLLYRRPLGAGDFVLTDPTGRELVRQPLPRELIGLAVTVTPR